MVTHITAAGLAALIRTQVRRAQIAGASFCRNPDGLEAHLSTVAERGELVAARPRALLPPEIAPDPVAAFVAGAWHDGGKIWNGDDYHEIASATEVLDRGLEWGSSADLTTNAPRCCSGPRAQSCPISR
jgi:hypothetical protein